MQRFGGSAKDGMAHERYTRIESNSLDRAGGTPSLKGCITTKVRWMNTVIRNPILLSEEEGVCGDLVYGMLVAKAHHLSGYSFWSRLARREQRLSFGHDTCAESRRDGISVNRGALGNGSRNACSCTLFVYSES